MTVGVYGYVGVPSSGKSTLALAHLFAERASRRNGAVILDFGAVRQFRETSARLPSGAAMAWVRAASCESAGDYALRGGLALWTPRDPFESEALAARLHDVHAGVSVLLDEAYYVWPRNVSAASPWSVFIRQSQHHYGNAYFTSQRYGDLSPDVQSVVTALYVFRCTAQRDLDRLWYERGLARATVVALPQHQALRSVIGFA